MADKSYFVVCVLYSKTRRILNELWGNLLTLLCTLACCIYLHISLYDVFYFSFLRHYGDQLIFFVSLTFNVITECTIKLDSRNIKRIYHEKTTMSMVLLVYTFVYVII